MCICCIAFLLRLISSPDELEAPRTGELLLLLGGLPRLPPVRLGLEGPSFSPRKSNIGDVALLFSSEFPKTCNSLLNVTLMGCKAVKRNKIKSLEFAQSLKWPLKYSTFHEHDRRERDDNSFYQELVQEHKMLDDHRARGS